MSTPFMRGCPSAAAAMLALSGCASIATFSVTPTQICPGDKVIAQWDVTTGSATLAASPEQSGSGPVAQRGELGFTPTATTRFVLKAQSLYKSAQVERDVSVLPPTSALSLGGIAACSFDRSAVALELTIPDEVASRSRRVLYLSNEQSRQLDIAKEGVRANIAPGGTTDVFRQVALAGTWNLQTPVHAGESCDSVLAAMSHRFLIKTKLTCGAQ